MNTKNIFKSIRTAALIGIGAGSTLFSISVDAQLLARPEMSFFGQYDVKMVSSQGLQAAWVTAVNPFQVLRPLTNDEMRADSYYLGINNSVSQGGANGYYSSPDQGFLNVKPATAIGVAMVYADCDDDMSTFQSSAAYLDFESNNACSNIEAAYLYWNGMKDVTISNYAAYPGLPTLKSNAGGAVGNIAGTAYKTVKFKCPGDVSYTSITAQRQLESTIYGTERYVCFADVSNLIKGKSSGLYWVADIRTASGKMSGGATSAWTLVVIYKNQNCPPRTIKFWDGVVDINSGNNQKINLTFGVGEVPATENSKSYLGLAVLDGENNAAYLANSSTTELPEFLEFSSAPGGSIYKINPFALGQTHHPLEEQPAVPVWDKTGLFLGNYYEGFSCSRITSWNESKGTNGNEIVRIPSQQNTLGYDAHHLRLPAGAIVPGATSATMTYYAGAQGGTSPFMAYMAIEAARPVLNFKLRSEGLQIVQPDGEITYVLTAANTGSSALPAGAYVLDTLDKSVDFVPGSVRYVNKTEPQSSEISNQGTDVDENLKLYLPTLAAGDGVNATDSVVIKFKVKVKDLSRMDIWNLICHRVVRNSAIAYYSNQNGDTFTAVTNTPSGCGIPNEYYDVYVDDPAITQQHLITHYINDTIYEQLMAASKVGSVIRVDSLVRTYLAERLVTMGKSASEASLYTLLDENGLQVSTSAAFAFDESNQKFIAELDLGQGCIETFNFEFIIAPAISNLVIQNPHCTGYSDGKVSFKVSRGVPSYNCMLVDSVDGRVVYQATTPKSINAPTLEIGNLSAGTYHLYVGDQGPSKAEAMVKIVNPQPLSVSISAPDSMCVGHKATLSAVVSGRDVAAPLSYVWEISLDSVNWTVMPFSTLTTVESTITADNYYRVYVCDNYCEAFSNVKIIADLTPDCKEIVTDSKGIEEQSTLIYPNPVKTGFTIKTGKSQNEVKVFDMNGAILLQQLVPDKALINISNLPKANYIIEVNKERVKVIKE